MTSPAFSEYRVIITSNCSGKGYIYTCMNVCMYVHVLIPTPMALTLHTCSMYAIINVNSASGIMILYKLSVYYDYAYIKYRILERGST